MQYMCVLGSWNRLGDKPEIFIPILPSMHELRPLKIGKLLILYHRQRTSEYLRKWEREIICATRRRRLSVHAIYQTNIQMTYFSLIVKLQRYIIILRPLGLHISLASPLFLSLGLFALRPAYLCFRCLHNWSSQFPRRSSAWMLFSTLSW